MLKNKKRERSRYLDFLVWCMVWGDKFIITPSEFWPEKASIYPALVIVFRLENPKSDHLSIYSFDDLKTC